MTTSVFLNENDFSNSRSSRCRSFKSLYNVNFYPIHVMSKIKILFSLLFGDFYILQDISFGLNWPLLVKGWQIRRYYSKINLPHWQLQQCVYFRTYKNCDFNRLSISVILLAMQCIVDYGKKNDNDTSLWFLFNNTWYCIHKLIKVSNSQWNVDKSF